MLKRNLIANYLGQGWTALMGLAFIPLYIKYLGIEAYGLIGFFAVLQAWLSVLDMGMTPTLNREMARFTGGTRSAISIRDLLRSVEIIAIGIAVSVALGIWAAAAWLASYWLRAEALPIEAVATALSIMGAVTALRFIEGVYRSCIIGLQRQVLFNVVNSALATLRSLGAVGILIWVTPTIEAFFIWQGIVSLLSLAVLALITYDLLPKSERDGIFSVAELRGISRFAAGMMGITILALLLTQIDKILLARLLTLSEYGYYALAAVAASGLYITTGPIAQAWFPRMSELHANNQQAELIKTYHLGAQLISVFTGSAAIVMIIFSETILRLWTRDPELSNRTANLLSLLALGNLLNSFMQIPYQTQLAYGWTSLTMRINIVFVIIVVPAILWVTPRYGAVGAAWVWVSINAGYVAIGIHFMYRKILTSEKWRWYVYDIFSPLIAALFAALIVRQSFSLVVDSIEQVLVLGLAASCTLAAAIVATPNLWKPFYSLVLFFMRGMASKRLR